jgi:hypothetical protein
MRKLLPILLILCFTNDLLKAQTGKAGKLQDSVDVIKFAKKHSKRFNTKPDASFKVSYNEILNKWVYNSYTLSYSRKGVCKGLNGCRIYRHVTILLNTNGKYTVQKDSTRVEPNYE